MTAPSPPPPAPFDNAACYDALIDWPKRLARETLFFKKHFAAARVRRVLDVACGTGRHAALFHQWGLEVQAADISASMIDHARATQGQHPGLQWVQRSFTDPPETPGRFDAVVCLGNSLALADAPQARRKACASMMAALRPGGICIIQVLNLWRLHEGPTLWQKCRRVVLNGQDHILIKALHRTGNRGFVDLLDLQLHWAGEMDSQFDTASFAGIEAQELATMIRPLGAERIEAYGDYQGTPYERTASADLIVIAHKQPSA